MEQLDDKMWERRNQVESLLHTQLKETVWRIFGVRYDEIDDLDWIHGNLTFIMDDRLEEEIDDRS